MSKLHTLASVNGAALSGANLKATNVSTWNALQAVGLTDSPRATVTASATLTMARNAASSGRLHRGQRRPHAAHQRDVDG
jgi:hypothetical protein